MTSLARSHPLLKVVNNLAVELPTPSNLSNWWNLGSLLGLCLSSQILTGMLLSMHYAGDIALAFQSVSHLMRDVNYGWLFRVFHTNGASLFFVCLYLHIGRGIYYGGYRLSGVWSVGVIIFLSTMATAFLGYVLPWGQMSFWGATVITNLCSAIPYLGPDLVLWLWGGFAVDGPTLTRFFSLHFLLPFVIIFLAAIHLVFLHQEGSSNSLGVKTSADKVLFHPYFTSKDLLSFFIFLSAYFYLNFFLSWSLGDPENFIAANPLVTPVHIQPEWYFLFAYAILRAIPNKLGGVIALVSAIIILLALPLTRVSHFQSMAVYPVSKGLFWVFVNIVLLLTWIGASPVEDPYIWLGETLTYFYFSYYLLHPLVKKVWDTLMA